jgi:lysyl-tRNA synthetase class 2
MKQLLAGGSGSIFQVAHVFRGGEVGPRHREEFHLVEWYRVGEGAFEAVERDVEAIAERVSDACAEFGGEGSSVPRAGRWTRRVFSDLWEETVGREMPVGAEELEREIVAVSEGQAHPLSWADGDSDPALRELDAWTSLFSWWSDRHLDPWLQRADGGLHLHGFPAALAALAQVEGPRAHRFESYAAGVELANGYLELRDGAQQRLRFERVNAQRARHGLPALPISASFCDAVGRLPACAGVAMGLERLLCVAIGASELSELLLPDAL